MDGATKPTYLFTTDLTTNQPCINIVIPQP